jgi:hypothetical protein
VSEIGKIPTLDKGYVQIRCCAPNGLEIDKIRSEIYRGSWHPNLVEMSQVYLNVKCPYFLLIPLVSSGIRALSAPGAPTDAYVPDVGSIKSGSLDSDREISESMSMTIDSLMLNQKAYAKEGCNTFLASITTPVAAYWSGILYGSLRDWLRFCGTPGLHPMVKEYQRSVSGSLSVEYKNLEDLIRQVK